VSRERDVWELYDRERQENDELREQLAEANAEKLRWFNAFTEACRDIGTTQAERDAARLDVAERDRQLAEARAENTKLRRRVEALTVVAEQSPITDETINKINAAKGGWSSE
jgi:hypothetical protein